MFMAEKAFPKNCQLGDDYPPKQEREMAKSTKITFSRPHKSPKSGYHGDVFRTHSNSSKTTKIGHDKIGYAKKVPIKKN